MDVGKYYCNVEVHPRKRRLGVKSLVFVLVFTFNLIFSIINVCGFNSNQSEEVSKNIESAKSSQNVEISLNDIFSKSFGEIDNNVQMKSKMNKILNKEMKKDKSKNEDEKNEQNKHNKQEKVAYLTFDDGPTAKITPQILKILKELDVKATFFVLGEMCMYNPEILKEEQASGHLICNHTYSHDYDKIYSGTDAFMKEVAKCEENIRDILKDEWNSNKIFRFPGGSFSKKFDPFKKELEKNGYAYYDWNVLNGDSEAIHVPVEKLIRNTVESMGEQKKIIILMHDSSGKETTVKALPSIIRHIREKGYVFKTLDQYEDNI